MQLEEFRPRTMLVSKQTQVDQPRFPVIDVHNHLGEEFGGWTHHPVSDLLAALDEANVAMYFDLDGGWGEDILVEHLKVFKEPAPGRFRIFGGVDWAAWPEHGDHFPDWAAKRLVAQKNMGAEGLKIWKPLGLSVRDHQGALIAVDDPRLDPIWQTAAELKLPVMIHVADPVAFFEPVDHHNERWEELHAFPDWQFTSPPFPPFMTILNGLANLIQRHPATTFIGAHVGCYAENLAWVGHLLEWCPNFHVDISARIGELGRQPYTSRRFFMKYGDRILFGLDAGPQLSAYRLAYRFLETEDEYFNYSTSEVPGQGRWNVYGICLPDDILEKVYNQNATRLFGIA